MSDLGEDESGVEIGGMTAAVELRVLIMSCGRVVCENILHITLAMVPHRRRPGAF